MKRIAVFTGTRAEYGLLFWLMRDIDASVGLCLQLIVSGMHLSPEFGSTWQQVEADGFVIDAKVEMLLSSDTAVGTVKSMGLGTLGYADALDRLRPDALVILGDRFEALAIAQAALILRIPVVHIHGGELSEGAYDDAIRHAITKMAALHFTATEIYRRRVIQMGEAPDLVHNVGAIGLDHLIRGDAMAIEEVGQSLAFDISQPYILATYHPATASDEDPQRTTRAMLDAFDAYPDYRVVLTYPNADNGGRSIISMLDAYARLRVGKVIAVPSLGFRRYLTLLKGAAAVVGNSSSGIIEAPAVAVPTINIGVRQKGRMASASVLHCSPAPDAIREALAIGLSSAFRQVAREAVNPYGKGDASRRIAEILAHTNLTSEKRFHDLEFSF